MGEKTGISWTDATWNPTRGCSRVSEGCRNCYAEVQAARIVRMGKGKPTAYDGLVKLVGGEPRWTGDVRLVPDQLSWPLRKRKPLRIFVNSMSDLFHESLTNEQIAAVFGVMAACPQHTFQVLTKRAKRMREWFEWLDKAITGHWHARWGVLFEHLEPLLGEVATQAAWMRAIADEPVPQSLGDAGCHPWPLPNVWLGVSVENQAAGDERIPELLATPAAVRFLSCEPLIGEVDLDLPRCENPHHDDENGWYWDDESAMPFCSECDVERSYGHWLHLDGGIDWVIAGCESGPGARPCSVEWLRSLRDQCTEAGVAYFLKQATELRDEGPDEDPREVGYPSVYVRPATVLVGDGSRRKPGGVIELPYLDGVQHAAFPEVHP